MADGWDNNSQPDIASSDEATIKAAAFLKSVEDQRKVNEELYALKVKNYKIEVLDLESKVKNINKILDDAFADRMAQIDVKEKQAQDSISKAEVYLQDAKEKRLSLDAEYPLIKKTKEDISNLLEAARRNKEDVEQYKAKAEQEQKEKDVAMAYRSAALDVRETAVTDREDYVRKTEATFADKRKEIGQAIATNQKVQGDYEAKIEEVNKMKEQYESLIEQRQKMLDEYQSVINKFNAEKDSLDGRDEEINDKIKAFEDSKAQFMEDAKKISIDNQLKTMEVNIALKELDVIKSETQKRVDELNELKQKMAGQVDAPVIPQ